MRFHESDEYQRHDDMRLLHTGPKLSRDEGRRIFREMVRAESRNGQLSDLRRRRLIQYAAALQLTPLEASRIVTEVCFEHQVEVGEPPVLYRVVEAAAAPHRWPVWLKISIVLAGAFAGQYLLLRLL